MAKVQRTIQVTGDLIEFTGNRIASTEELFEMLHAHLAPHLQPGERVISHALDRQSQAWTVTVEKDAS